MPRKELSEFYRRIFPNMDYVRPLISVLMGVYNCEQTLLECIDSLLQQSEPRWELVACDDGSTDGTWELLKQWQERFPEKIHLIQNEQNRGLSFTLNRCLAAAQGAFIARMDADDRCSDDRLEKELNFLTAHPELAIVSTDMQCFDEYGAWGVRQYPTFPQPQDFIHGTPFCHAACMVRRDALTGVGGYSEDSRYERVEDFELWLRMYRAGYRGANIHEPLYQMRDDRNAASRRKLSFRVNEARVCWEAVDLLSLPPWKKIYALRPLVLGILPPRLYRWLHRNKLKTAVS